MRTQGSERARGVDAQLWVWVRTDDPEAVSALGVARALRGGEALMGLRRFRLVELRGPLPARGELEALLARSIQFYNPQKEATRLRLRAAEGTPLEAGERAVRVVERDGARRRAAERWWAAQTGQEVEVREGVVWALRFAPGAEGAAEELAVLRERGRGLLCNPHAEEHRVAAGRVPVPWLTGGRGGDEA